MRRLYDWVLSWAGTPHGGTALFVLAFVESSFFPVPPDVLLIASCMGKHRKWAGFALVCSIGSVLGGIAGYAIGYFLSDSVGQWLLEWVAYFAVTLGPEHAGDLLACAEKVPAISNELKALAGRLLEPGAAGFTIRDGALYLRGMAGMYFAGQFGQWAVGIAGFTPVPYKVFTITAGMFEMPLVPFIIASGLSRSARFFLVAGFIGIAYKYYGEAIRGFIDRYFNWLTMGAAAILLAALLTWKLL